jgi:hypothetical protein
MAVTNKVGELEAALLFIRRHALSTIDPEVRKLGRRLELIHWPSASRTRAEEQLVARVQRWQHVLEDNPFWPAPPGTFAPQGMVLAVQARDGQPITLTPLRSIVIYGSSGMGKTVAKQHVILGAPRLGLRVISLDPKNDDQWIALRDPSWLIFHEQFPWAPLQRVPYLSLHEQIALNNKMYTAAFFGGEHQRQVFNEAQHLVYERYATPSFRNLYDTILGLARKGETYHRIEAIRGAAARILRVIEQYPGPATIGSAHGPIGIPTSLLADYSLHIGMAVHNDVAEYLHGLLTWHVFLRNKYHQHRQPSHLISTDEGILAHSTSQSRLEEASITSLAAIGREFGLINLWTTLNAGMTSALLRSASAIHLAVPPTDGADAHEIARILGLNEEQRKYLLTRLRVGQCIVKLGPTPDGAGWTEPMLALIPPPAHGEGGKTIDPAAWEAAKRRAEALVVAPPPAPTITVIDHTSAAATAIATDAPARIPNETRLRTSNVQSIALNDNERKLLNAIAASPCMPCSYYYKQLTLHFQIGDRCKNKLVTLGLIDAEPMVVRSGRGGKGIGLRLTTQGLQQMGRQPSRGLRGHCSIQHEFLCRSIATATKGTLETKLGTKSVDVLLSYNSNDHQNFLDVVQRSGHTLAPLLALHDGDLVAIEIEVTDPKRSGARNVAANHDAGIALNIIAVPKAAQLTLDALKTAISPALYSRVVVIDAFTFLENACQTNCSPQAK